MSGHVRDCDHEWMSAPTLRSTRVPQVCARCGAEHPRDLAHEILARGGYYVTITARRRRSSRACGPLITEIETRFVRYDATGPIDLDDWDEVDVHASMVSSDPQDDVRILWGSIAGDAVSPFAIDAAACLLLMRLAGGNADPARN